MMVARKESVKMDIYMIEQGVGVEEGGATLEEEDE